jgi:streptogramin lyase
MAARKPRRFRPIVETLEARQVLATAISGAIAEYPVPTNGSPEYITPGPAGDRELWFTDSRNDRIGRINSAGIFDTFYQVPTQQAELGDITAGPDGNVWFLENLADQIGRVTPDGAFTEFPLGQSSVNLQRIITGPDGNLWFTESSANGTAVVGRITPAGQITQFPVPGNSAFHTPNDLTVGSDGALWLTEPWSDEIVRLTTAGQVHEFTTGISQGAFPLDITAGSDGNLWFTEPGTNSIGRITPAGAVTEYTVNIRPQSNLGDITAGSDGALWFMEGGAHIANQVGRITTDGSVREYAIPTYDHSNQSITAGPDGNIWFTEPNPDKIGMVNLNALFPHLEFGSSTYSANENAGSITVSVNRTGDPSGTVGLHYATSNGSAVAGVDYTAVSGDLIFGPGVTSQSFAIPILNAGHTAGLQTVNLTLSQPTGGAALGTPATAVLTIDDSNTLHPGQLQFSTTAYTTGESEGVAIITVNRLGGSDDAISVAYATQNGSAVAGLDYLATAGTLTFLPGETSRSFAVTIRDLGRTSGSASLILTLSNPTGGAVLGSSSQSMLTILDNDAPPVVVPVTPVTPVQPPLVVIPIRPRRLHARRPHHSTHGHSRR